MERDNGLNVHSTREHVICRCTREHISLRKPCERSLGIAAYFCYDGVAEDSYEENRYKLQKSIPKSG